MIALIWIVATLSAQGPIVVPIPEVTTFGTEAECAAFGDKMRSRTADFTRGMLHLDWSIPVQVAYECRANGQPA
ncbi:hypothetical protein [Pseudorhodoplanes sinuspersici]|uniref:Uncharacterized protein n=1 Tax=Pseudorhodoplanes sinuspersici TaxID=1235591 RepID=A0A1W6ZX37_9HYPH|nr:hypothetical protein [Pseudorhodoplanes sinuspersici]ARQ01876.1 hypothetical protein CAK95_24350 [Pseudorhodoplanes sinuspersici]RKE73641.1 hypothetical protein DFP91_1535 [Pseudorhodoplanes sinuspersici]